MVIHQNVVVWDQVYQKHKHRDFAMQGNFASLAKFYRDSENEKFRYQQGISLASEIFVR